MWLSRSLPPDDLWIFVIKLLAIVGRLEALQGLEAVEDFYSTKIFSNNVQIFWGGGGSNLCSLRRAAFLPLLYIFLWIVADSALTKDYSLPNCHACRYRCLHVVGRIDRRGGSARVWDRGRIIVLPCRWVLDSQQQSVAFLPFVCWRM